MEYLDLNTNPDRRLFLKGIGFVSLSLLLSTSLGGCESLLRKIANRPTRRRLRTGSAAVDADIATYESAVSLMSGLPASDPRRWAAQAAIHGTAGVGFNLCQHNTVHFFSWHRAYLLYFERICQKLTGRPDFGLPYWNWNQNPDINPAFLNPASPLFLGRTRTTATGLSAVQTSALDPIFPDTNFFTFSSQIEGTPHNSIHGWIGQAMGGAGSARDPVFWTHHCMVDYCWAKWNLELGNDNTNDPTWVNTSWNHFVDADGNPASATAGLTTLMPLLSYQYESSAIGSLRATRMADSGRAFEALKQRIERGADIRFDIKRRIRISGPVQISTARPYSTATELTASDFSLLLESDSARENIFASIGFDPPPTRNDFLVRVFVNLPGASAQTPTTDPHYAGSFAFFGTHVPGASGHEHAPSFLVNITNTLRELRGSQALSATSALSLQLVAVPYSDVAESAPVALALSQLELLVTPVIVQDK